MNLRVSVSKLESFRKVCETEWAKESELLREITDPTPLGWQARYGEALHSAIEDPEGTLQPDGTHSIVGQDGNTYSWPGEIVSACHAAWPKGCIFERRLERDYWIRGHRVTVAGRADSVLGVVIVEGKTRFGYVYAEEYSESLQWQCYLDAARWAHCVEYRIHEIGGMYADKESGDVRFSSPAWACGCETPTGQFRTKRKEPTGPCEDCGQEYVYRPGGPYLVDIHAFRCWRESGIEQNVRRWLERFVGWAESKNLLSYLENEWAA